MSSDLPSPGSPSAPAFGAVADKLTIETPEQTALEFAVAGIGSRFLALALDTLIQIAVGLVVGIAGAFAIGAVSAALPKAAVWTGAILILFYFALYFGYYALFEIIWNGQTPGKRKIGIRVIKDSGRPLTPAESIARNLMRIVDYLPFLYGVGIVSAVLNKQNKRLGDFVAGSIVVHERSMKEIKPVWEAMPSTSAFANPPVSPLGANLLTSEEVTMIDSFLQRRSALDFDVRTRIADQIFQRIKPKLASIPPDLTSVEKILETLAYERRSTGHYSA